MNFESNELSRELEIFPSGLELDLRDERVHRRYRFSRFIPVRTLKFSLRISMSGGFFHMSRRECFMVSGGSMSGGFFHMSWRDRPGRTENDISPGFHESLPPGPGL